MPATQLRRWFRDLLRASFAQPVSFLDTWSLRPRSAIPTAKRSYRRTAARLRIESLEERALLATFTVLNTLDGAGPAPGNSLREAIELANATPGADEIVFNIPGAGPHRINLLTPLDPIAGQVTIDATTQPGYLTPPTIIRPLIEIAGGGLTGSGLVLASNGSQIRGLSITNFNGQGISITGNNNFVQETWLGVTPDGVAAGNTGSGVLISAPAASNVIGGTQNDGAIGVSANNGQHGVLVTGATSGNTVTGMLIGIDPYTKNSAQPNTLNGISIEAGAQGGGLLQNSVGGNLGHGIFVDGASTVNVGVSFNFVGMFLDAASLNPIPNALDGIHISGGSQLAFLTGNSVAANGDDGIDVDGASVNSFAMNRVGVGINLATGVPAALPNVGNGVRINASNITIGSIVDAERNYIAGNTGDGIRIESGTGNRIFNNYIGVGPDGITAIPNQGNGVTILSDNNIVGTNLDSSNDEAEGNLISGNVKSGVYIEGANNLVAGNVIGLNAAGDTAIPNATLNPPTSDAGVRVLGANNTIGGYVTDTDIRALNVISGNALYGLSIEGATATGNIVHGNYIGTNMFGTSEIHNFSYEIAISQGADGTSIGLEAVGGPFPTLRSGNVIGINGISIHTTSNTGLYSNYIGTDSKGAYALGRGSGILLQRSSNTTIGSQFGENIISGNGGAGTFGTPTGPAIEIFSSTNTVIDRNRIGTDVNGNYSIRNGVGITIEYSPFDSNWQNLTVKNNQIAGNYGMGLSIGGNNANGIVDITNNTFGLNSEGLALGNGQTAISIRSATATITENVISSSATSFGVGGGSLSSGIYLQTVTGGKIQKNIIGLDPTGRFPRGNKGDGIVVYVSENVVIGTDGDGTNDATEGNTISGNGGAAISTVGTSLHTRVQGNKVGTDISGVDDIGNNALYALAYYDDFTHGAIQGEGYLIGTDGDGRSDELEGNIISGNYRNGLLVKNSVISGNYIGVGKDGTTPVPNQGHGVVVTGGVTQIGTDGTAGANSKLGNVISGNWGSGIVLLDQNTKVAGNLIGTDRDGVLARGNLGNGIQISGFVNGASQPPKTGVQNNVIGGEGTASNTIAFNSQAGIRVLGDNADNTIEQNRIYNNGALSIDAGAIGVSPNDSAAQTTQRNFPVLTDAYVDGTEFVVRGFSDAGVISDLYLASPNVAGFGDGLLWLARQKEGATEDLDASTGTYSNADFGGRNVANGTVAANRFEYRFPVPDGIQYGSRVAAVHVGEIGQSPRLSEFGNSILVGDQPGFTLPGSSLPARITLPGLQVVQQGERLAIEGSFTDYDSTEWSAKIEFGDGTIQPIALREDFTFTALYRYATPGNYTVTVRIVDNALAEGIATMPVTVQNVAPEIDVHSLRLLKTRVKQGEAVVLEGTFEDGMNTEAHTLTVQWGDGKTETIPIPAGATQFTASHEYPSVRTRLNLGTGVDFYDIQVSVSDSAGAEDRSKLILQAIVDNVLPFNLQLTALPTSIVEGGTVKVNATFEDAWHKDNLQVRIDWGDGSPQEVADLASGFPTIGEFTHIYQSVPRFGNTYELVVELVDFDEPLKPVTVTRDIKVTRAEPEIVELTTDNSTIAEGQTVSLGGTFTDANAMQKHKVKIDWGDGSSVTQFDLAAGVPAFSGIKHLYRDDSKSEQGEQFTITVWIAGEAAPLIEGAPPVAGSKKTFVKVTNVAPTVSHLQLNNLEPNAVGNYEGDTVELSGQVSDAGAADTHEVTIDWGDGRTSTAEVDRATGIFKTRHQFIDQSTAISVTADDGDGGIGNATYNPNVLNVAPTVFIVPSATNVDPNLIELLSSVSDVPGDSLFTYTWTASSPGQPNQTGTSANIVVDRSAALTTAVWTVKLLVDDGDGGVGQEELSFLAGTAGDDMMSIDDSHFTGVPSDKLLVLGLGGQDTLDGSGVLDPAKRLILDGGADNDVLFGGAGDDTFYLRQGDDSANVASGVTPANAAVAQQGNDEYIPVPNSTHKILDNYGSNSLDFSLASFGVTFDLSQINTSTMVSQDVDPTGASGQHFIVAQGTFSKLAGGDFADTLTAASQSKVFGGRGNDKLRVGANTSGASLFGGADDDTLETTGIAISSLSFSGDEGSDLLQNLGTISSLTFRGGADDDKLWNQGSIGGILDFAGDDGNDYLQNFDTGKIDLLTFSGGADDDNVINAGTLVELGFSGGEGADYVRNGQQGTIERLTFVGGSDGDMLDNIGELGELHFTGDYGEDYVQNTGNIDTLVFFGGADDDYVCNDGVLGELNFNGDDGADIVFNAVGHSIGKLMFSGGADNDRLDNQGSLTELTFNGDDGVDELSNRGVLTTLTFTGGTGDDRLENFSGGAIGDFTFNGGANEDYVANSGTITKLNFAGDDGEDYLQNHFNIGTLVFNGGADDDYLINTHTLSDVTFNGGADDDSLMNISGTITQLSFTGDAGSDLIHNKATIVGMATFVGGLDDDYFVNDGKMGDVTFTGGADNDLLLNLGVLGEVSFAGDGGVDRLINEGPAKLLTFDGGAGDDLLNNRGQVQQDVYFTGGLGSDRLHNSGAAFKLTFLGGADDDLMINTGALDVLIFRGDDGDDALLNQSDELDTLDFEGDKGKDVVVNEGDSVGTLTFRGGDGNDVMINEGDSLGSATFEGGAGDDRLLSRGEHTGAIIFEGDASVDGVGIGEQGDDTLVLFGSGTNTATVTFNGYGGSDILQNNAEGMGLIAFFGGTDQDTLENIGDSVLKIDFRGEDGLDVLNNRGNFVGLIEFDGGADDDSFYNSGNQLGKLSFTGGAGDEVLSNAGDSLGALLYFGDAGDDKLFNSGAQVTGIDFTGGDGDDRLFNLGLNAEGITFNGGVGSDRFENRVEGARSTGLSFFGGADNDVMINVAIDVGTLSFDGGTGSDDLLNEGVNLGSLAFAGGDGSDRLVNRGNSFQLLQFNGQLGDDTLFNSGNSFGKIDFEGGAGTDVFQNNGHGNSAGTTEIDFDGGADSDALINNGDSLGGVSFDGGDGADILQNNGKSLKTLGFSGGADDDLLQNNGNFVETLTFDGGLGNDRLLNYGDGLKLLKLFGESGNDSLINKGNQVAEIFFAGGAGSDLLQVAGQDVGQLTFNGDEGADTLLYESVRAAALPTNTVTFTSGAGNDMLIWLGVGAAQLVADMGAGDDKLTIGGNGILSLAGGSGDDLYVFQGMLNAQVVVTEDYTGAGDSSSDTLDFSPLDDGPLNLDLRSTVAQMQGSQLSITLSDRLGIENVYGTHRGDTIFGNARDNLISGAEFLEPVVLPVAQRRTEVQWVWLDFDSATDAAAGEHVYTQSERDAIQAAVEAAYHGPMADPQDPATWWFNVRFTQARSDVAGLPSDGFATILFNETPSFGRPGGEASEVDLGNQNLGGTAVVQVNGLLGGQLAQGDRSPSDQAQAGDTEEGEIKIGARKPVATSQNFIALASKIAAHELGHLLGLRHYDTFGPIGFGVYATPGVDGFNPVYAGVAGGYEAAKHMLGSGASIGTDRFNDLQPLFFGEREAAKLAYANSLSTDVNRLEIAGDHQTIASAQPLPLVQLQVPNTLGSGLNVGKVYAVQAAAVLGAIKVGVGGVSHSDYYSFTGRRGEIANVELSSLVLRGDGSDVDQWIDSVLRVRDAGGNPVAWFGGQAINDDEFESSDSILFDIVLPEDGTYYIEVDTFVRLPGSLGYAEAVARRAELEARSDLTAVEQAWLARIQDTIDDTDIGNYHLLLTKFATANASDDIDRLKGNGGVDRIIGGPGDDYSLSLELGASAIVDLGNPFSRVINFSDRAASSWLATVDYGDGTGVQSISVAVDALGQPSIALAHDYRNAGDYTISVVINNDFGLHVVDTMTVSASAALTAGPVLVNSGSAQRSNIERMVYQFSEATNLGAMIDSGTTANAVKLFRSSGEEVALPVTSYAYDIGLHQLTIDLTIDGPGQSPRTILIDGRYELRMDTALIGKPNNSQQRLRDDDANVNDGFLTTKFHRLEADFDGNAVVDYGDRTLLYAHYGLRAGQPGYDSDYDINFDGTIGTAEQLAWRKQLNRSV